MLFKIELILFQNEIIFPLHCYAYSRTTPYLYVVLLKSRRDLTVKEFEQKKHAKKNLLKKYNTNYTYLSAISRKPSALLFFFRSVQNGVTHR